METSPNFASLTFRITTGTKNYVSYCWRNMAELCWLLLVFTPSSHKLQGYHWCLGICWRLQIARGFRAALHNGEGRDCHRARAGLGHDAWGCSPLSATGTLWGDGIWGWGQHPAAFRVPFAMGAEVGSVWEKELHLQGAVNGPSHGGHTGLLVSEVICFVLILELWCIFYCYCCLSQFFRNAYTRQSFRIKWKAE